MPRFIVWAALAAWLWPLADVSAFAGCESENGALEARGAVNVSSVFNHNPDSRILYPNRTDGRAASAFRLLLDADAGEVMAFRFNGYQGFTAATYGVRGPGATYEGYRTKYLFHDWTGDETTTSAPLALDQLSFKFFTGPVDITMGRQPIGLANNFIFTPNDLFHPFSAEAVDRAFRPGVDAARVDVRVGDLSQASAMGALGYDGDGVPQWERSAAILRGSVNAAGFDWIVEGGKAEGRYLAGAAFSGELWIAGVRAEGNMSIPIGEAKDLYGQVSAGFDHRWENSLHLMVEYYYHGNGADDADDYLQRLMDPAFVVDPYMGRHYAGLMLSGEATPLIRLQGIVLANLLDPSCYLSPSVVYYAADEVELIGAAAVPVGRTPAVVLPEKIYPRLRSEYGSYPWTLSLQTRVYF